MSDEKKPFHNPFGALREKLGDLPAGPAPAPPAPPKGPARAVVRMERKGRGGKEVTAVEQNHAKATVAPRLRREDGELEPDMDAGEMDRRVRALQPWPGATCARGGGRWQPP